MSTLGRLTLLVDGRRPPGVYRTASDALAATLAAALRARGLAAWVLDTRGIDDGKAAFLDRCAHDLALPAWFGRNWDALADAVRDLPAGVLLWVGADSLPREVLDVALDVLGERARAVPAFSAVLLDGEASVPAL